MPVRVELEKDLSIKLQLLDVVIVSGVQGALPFVLPDGFDTFGAHNLISFKSHQETLDGWTLDELIGHYVNYRKQVSPDFDHLLDVEEFRLYAVCVRFPRSLSQQHRLHSLQPGVYEVHSFTRSIRIIVIHELPQVEQNAILHLFSAVEAAIRFGANTYHPRSRDTTTLLFQLFAHFREERRPMPYTIEDFKRDGIELIKKDKEILHALLEDLSTEQRLESVPVEKRLESVPVEQRLSGLTPEQVLAALPAEMREALRQQLLREDGKPPATGSAEGP